MADLSEASHRDQLDEEGRDAEPNKESAKDILISEGVKNAIWLLSRIGFAAALVGLAYFIKIPVDQLLQVNLESDLRELRRNERLEHLRVINNLKEQVDEAVGDYEDLADGILERGAASRFAGFSHAMELAEGSANQLLEVYYHRPIPLTKHRSSMEFRLRVFRLGQALTDGLTSVRVGNAGVVTREMRSRIETDLAYVRRIRRNLEADWETARRELAVQE